MKRILSLSLILLFGGAAYGQDGDLSFLQGRYAEAAAAFERLPESGKSAPVLNRLAMSYHLLGRFKEAEAGYNRAVKADGELAAPRNNLGALYYSQKKFGDADREFKRAADRNGDSSVLTANLRASRYARDNQRSALQVAAEAAASRPLLIEPVDSAAADFLAVVPLLPAQIWEATALHETRGEVFIVRKMFEDAVIEYKRSIALDRFNPAAINRLGIAYHNLNKLRDAEQQYREALRLRPNYLDAMNNLAVIEFIREDFEGALSRYGKALRLQPQSATILRNMGACLFAMKRHEEGMRAWQLALSIDPFLFDPQPGGAGGAVQMNQKNPAIVNYFLARIFALRADKDRAISFLSKAVELGFADLKMLRDEPAFGVLAADERFVRMLESISQERSGID